MIIHLRIQTMGTILCAELVASQLTHSLIILTDAYHILYNILSILCLIISLKMSNETTVKNTFGWARIEVLGMLVNMTFLVALTFSLLVEGIQQLVHSSHEISEPTNYYLLFAFGVCGLVSNVLYFYIVSGVIKRQTSDSNTRQRADSLRTQEKIVFNNILGLNIEIPSTSDQKSDAKEITESLLTTQSIKEKSISLSNEQNVFYGLLRDVICSLLLIICGISIVYTTQTFAHLSDPIFGIISAIVFCFTLYPNIKNTGLILLQTVPENIDVRSLKKTLLKEFPIILNIHDMHVWCLTASQIIATCHIILPKQSSKTFGQFSQQLKKFFQNQGIVLATIQPEFDTSDGHNQELSCLMKCSMFSNTNCDSYTCCSHDNNQPNQCHNNSSDSEVFEEVISTNSL